MPGRFGRGSGRRPVVLAEELTQRVDVAPLIGHEMELSGSDAERRSAPPRRNGLDLEVVPKVTAVRGLCRRSAEPDAPNCALLALGRGGQVAGGHAQSRMAQDLTKALQIAASAEYRRRERPA